MAATKILFCPNPTDGPNAPADQAIWRPWPVVGAPDGLGYP